MSLPQAPQNCPKARFQKQVLIALDLTGADHPGLRDALDYLRDGEDTPVIWQLDRLGRSLKNLIELINLLEKRGIGFQSLQESIDTTTSGGKLIFHILGALAEFERNLIRERTNAGFAAARARGKKGGRRKALDEEKTQRLYKLYDEKNADGSRKYAIKEICEMMDISRSSLYRYLGKGRRLWSVNLDEGKFTHLSLRPTKSDGNLLRPTPLLHRNCCFLPTIPGKM